MKIGIDIRTLMDRQYSGVSLYTLDLIRGILQVDKKNDYVLYYNSFHDIKDRLPYFDQKNVRIIKTEYPNKIFNYLMQKGFSYPKIDQLLDVDLFFMPHLNFSAISSGCKKVITIHDLSFIRYKEFFSFRKNVWHNLLGVRNMLKRFDKIIAVSENTKRDIMELCDVPEEKIEVVYSGISPVFRVINDHDKLNEIKKKYNLPDQFILFLGNLEPRKNIEGSIEAFDIMKTMDPDLKHSLVIAGGKGWKYEKIFVAKKGAKHRDDIRFLDYVSEEDKVYLYNLASLFLFPSFYEGFGFPPLESMACGTPVVSSNSSSLTEVVQDGGVLVDPYNINEIATAMMTTLKNGELRKKNIRKGYEIVKDFSWERAIEKYLNIFNTIK